jgi:hypothetical protein
LRETLSRILALLLNRSPAADVVSLPSDLTIPAAGPNGIRGGRPRPPAR